MRYVESAVRLIPLLFMLDFACFMITSFYFGGDALHGRVIEGHYFVGSRGNFNEVSKAVFNFNRWHGISIFAVLGMAAITQLVVRVAGWPIDRARQKREGLRGVFVTISVIVLAAILINVFNFQYHLDR